jgi:transglutaminase-like putative cysteine protease
MILPTPIRVLVIVLLFHLQFSAFGQKNINKIKADQLKQYFKDDKLAAYDHKTVYSFDLVKENLLVSQADVIGMISLEGNVNTSQHLYYNDHVSIASAQLEYTNGKSVEHGEACGNYEVEDIFYSDAKVCSYKFNFLAAGTEIIFKSKLLYHDPKYLTKVFFHDVLSIDSRTIEFKIPAEVNVELVEKNFEGFDIQKSWSKDDAFKIYTYTIKKINALKSESNSLGMLYYYPHIVVVTKDYTTSSQKKSVISSASDLYHWYASIVKDVNNDPAQFKAEVLRLTANAKTTEEKIKAIYYWVQDNIKYIAFEDGIAGFKPEAAHLVYQNRYGDCKGMANLTKEMLKVVGFDSRLAWIGTNRIPYSYELPSLAVDNHMICTVNADGKFFVLDPTEKFIALGKHGERIQGKEMMIEDGDQFQLKRVPVADADQNLISRNEEIILNGELLQGKGRVVINGESLKNILYFKTNIRQDDQKKIFDDLVVSDHQNTDHVEVLAIPAVDRDKPMEVTYTYGLNNKVTKFDNDLYIDIDWNKTFNNYKIEEDRMSDYYFNRKIKNTILKRLALPPGYKISHLPSGISKKHNDFSFNVKFEQKGSDLFYTNEIIVNQGIIRKADFKTWNLYIKELSDVYGDQIVLTKIK